MRAIVFTEDLLEAAWKLAGKPAAGMRGVPDSNIGVKTANRLSFNKTLMINILVCFGIFFSTLLLLFLVCAVEDPGSYASKVVERRILKGSIATVSSIRLHNLDSVKITDDPPARAAALHGMGVLFRKGNRSMNELILAHLTERVTAFELRMFVRTLYRSGALARADLVILFPSNSVRDEPFYNVIEEECDLGFKKASSYFDSGGDYRNGSTIRNFSSISIFNAEAFRRAEEERNNKSKKACDRPSIGVGSIMGFEMEELDPDSILESFIDDPPAQLRRWVCYQLLLGYLRHKYRSVLLARIGDVVILGDALAAIRNSNGLFLLTDSRPWDVPATGEEFLDSSQDGTPPRRRLRRPLVEAVYGAKIWRSLSMEERQKRLISSGVIAGTMSPVRALSNAMVNEIIRVTMGRKSRAAFPDQVPLSYLVHRTSVLRRKVKGSLHLDGLSGNGRSWTSLAHIIQRDLCNPPDDAALYPDCIQSPEPSSFGT